MTIQLMFHNPISNNEDYLVFEETVLDYCNWRNIKDTKTDNDICEILNLLLIYLDCSRMLSGMPINRTTNIRYKDELGEYWYYLLKFNNQLLYNEYFDKLINLHTKNIIIENSRIKEVKPKVTKTKKPKVENKYFRYTTKDMFTNEEVFVYRNPKTGDEITSTNPDLLEELNKPKEKVRKRAVDVSFMTFSFKKK